MIIKVEMSIYVNVRDAEQGEEAAHTLGRLDNVIGRGFPHGEIIQTDVENATPVSDEEIAQKGLDE
jgi:hypothetical protein